MLHSSHADGWMDCLFCLLSLPDPTVSLGQGTTRGCGGITVTAEAGGETGVVVTYTLANYISSPPRPSLSVRSRDATLCPKRTSCWGLEKWLPIISKYKKPPTCQSSRLPSSSHFQACNATLCLSLSSFPSTKIWYVGSGINSFTKGWLCAQKEVETNNKTQFNSLHVKPTAMWPHALWLQSLDLYNLD